MAAILGDRAGVPEAYQQLKRLDPSLAAQYTRNWEAHAAHADPYGGRR